MAIEHIPANLVRYRKVKGMTKVQISADAGITRQAYHAVESGKTMPKSSTLVAIAGALGVSVSDLLSKPASFSSLRFRSSRTMSKRDQAQRDVILHGFRRWLDDFNSLEELLESTTPWKLDGMRESDPVAAAGHARRILGIQTDEPVDDIVGLLESAGIKVYVQDITIPALFGFSAGVSDGGPAIAVNTSAGISIERQIFTSAHELGHLLLHRDSYGQDDGSDDSQEEQQANLFASHFLLPKVAFEKELEESSGLPFVDLVLHIKRKFKVSYRTVLVRLVQEYGHTSGLYQEFSITWNRRTGSNLRNNVEPDPLADPIAPKEVEALAKHDFVAGRLARLVKRAYERELITVSRAAEILQIPLEAMRNLEADWVAVKIGA